MINLLRPMFEESTTEQLKKDVARLMEDMARLRRELRQTGTASLEAWREEAETALHGAGEEARRKAERLDQYVREQPWVAAGVAAAVGAVLAALLAGGRKRR
jgi:ElaB/YqjD/DUF883 family membrane-anchored ribosome-binding protein